MKFNGRIFLFTFFLVLIATACKYFFGPDLDWSGFSPVIAIALFSGFIIRQKDYSFLLPLIALLVSDAVIQLLYNTGRFDYPGFYAGQWKNYAVLLVSTLIGWAIRGRNYMSLLGTGLLAPVVFFLLSNFMVWAGPAEALYPRTFSGLMTCYEAGLPFFRNSVVSTLVFLPLIAVCWNFFTQKKTELRVA